MATQGILDRYRSSQIRHPSWRIYRALDEIKEMLPELKKKNIFDEDELDNLSPQTFGLREDIDIFYPYTEVDDLTGEIIGALINVDYTDNGKYGIPECMSIFCDIDGRQLLEGMLLEGAMIGDIAIELGYTQELVQTYATVFFDCSVWRSPTDKMAYLKNGVIGNDGSMKNAINKSGVDYVAAHYFNKPSQVKMEKALADTFGLAYTLVKQNINSNEPEDQDKAYKMAKLLIDTFKELRNSSKQDGGIRELSIALHTDTAPKTGLDDLK